MSLFKDANSGEAWGGALKGAGKGAAIGSVVPGVGTVAGGVIGGIFGGIKGLLSKRAKDRARKDAAAAAAAASVGPERELKRRSALFAATARTMAAHPEIYGKHVQELLTNYGFMPGPLTEDDYKIPVAPLPTATPGGDSLLAGLVEGAEAYRGHEGPPSAAPKALPAGENKYGFLAPGGSEPVDYDALLKRGTA